MKQKLRDGTGGPSIPWKPPETLLEMQILGLHSCPTASELLGWTLQGIRAQLRSGKLILVEMGELWNMTQWQKPGLSGLVRRKGLAPFVVQVIFNSPYRFFDIVWSTISRIS